MDWRFGQLMAVTVNMHLPRNKKPFTAEDFMPVNRDADRDDAAARRNERRRLNDAAEVEETWETEAPPPAAEPDTPSPPDDERRARVAVQLESVLRGMMGSRHRNGST
jgi:hypothetical protein